MLMESGGVSDKQLFRDVEVEIAIQKFLTDDPAGQYLFDKAKQAVIRAALELANQSLADAQENFVESYASMQFPVRLLEWLKEAQNNGQRARETLHDRDRMEKF